MIIKKISKFLFRKKKVTPVVVPQNKKIVSLILNSNPWFSAVTDYSLQVALYLKEQNIEILYGAEKKSTVMDEVCKKNNIPFFYIPIHNVNVFNFIYSVIKVSILFSSKKMTIHNVFVFEGREHTLMMIIKIIFPFLWHNKKLIRIRGQSQAVKKSFFSILIYKYYTDKIIFVANCVLNRVKFKLPEKKYIVQLYCKNLNYTENNITNYTFSPKLPSINFNELAFLVLGRFDPVKGHDLVIQSYLASNLKEKSQLILIGKSESINAEDLFNTYIKNSDEFIKEENKYYIKINNKNIFIIDEKLNNMNDIMQNIHFGLIPSLESEVICRVGVEFLQSAVPCLYSDAGALPEVFSDFPEFKFQKGNLSALQNLIENTESIFKDKNSYTQLKIKAKKIGTEKYSLDHFQVIPLHKGNL